MVKEREEINFATRKLSGVRRMTIKVIHTFLENMKIKVTTTVTTPENNWVNPSSNPSERISVSAMIRLTISPVLC